MTQFPIKVPDHANCPPENHPADNCPLCQLPPRQLPPDHCPLCQLLPGQSPPPPPPHHSIADPPEASWLS